jgi:hypothetical protein
MNIEVRVFAIMVGGGPIDGLQVEYEDIRRVPPEYFAAVQLPINHKTANPFDPTPYKKVTYKRGFNKFLNLSGDRLVIPFHYEGEI